MAKNQGITIVGAEVKNFMRIEFARVQIDNKKGIVRVTGKNDAGKTSLLSALASALGGAKQIVADNPIFARAKDPESFVRVLLSNGFRIERKFTPATPKGYLTVTSGDGGKYNQSKLDEWLGKHAFDPISFFDLDAQKRTQLLLSLSAIPDLPQRLASLRGRRKEAYEARTPFIRLERAAKSFAQPEGDRPEPVDTSAEMARLQALRTEQAQRERESGIIARHTDLIENQREVIADLEAQLRDAIEKQRNYTDLRQEARDRLAALPDRTEAIAAVEAHIADANKVQQELQPWLAYERAQREIAEAQAEQERLGGIIEKCDEDMVTLLEEARIPVPGLTFDPEGEPLVNGRPFEEAGGAQRIDVAVAVALAANPDLRICLLSHDEGNALDLDALARLDAKAKEHGFQVWLCRIGIEGKGEVHIEDGKSSETLHADA